jgi:tetratricopeptide (TPR) repeat protein
LSLKVFLSSTARDLAPYRESVAKAVESMDDVDCIWMERFGARDWDADTFCRSKVDDCDVFVGVVGHFYGSSPKHSELSYTEREYDATVAARKPRLMFLLPDNYPVPAGLREADALFAKQQAFRSRVKDDRVASLHSTNPDALATAVTMAIRNWEHEQPKETPDLPIPKPPDPDIVHPYPLANNFTGRSSDRAALTQWFRTNGESILTLDAIGGMGKSALAWVWVNHDVLAVAVPGVTASPADAMVPVPQNERPEGVIWWSFYEEDASFQEFLKELYAYDRRSRPPADMPMRDLLRSVVSILQTKRYLIVFDGFERELRAYGSLGAAYQSDAVDEANDEQRACRTPATSDFLRQFAARPMHSRLLISTRLHPRELEGLPTVHHRKLDGLSEDDAIRFLTASGVHGPLVELRAVTKRFGNHPLVLRLLAGMIAHDPERPGDVLLARDYAPVEKAVSRNTHILKRAYESLAEPVRALLSSLAAFRSPVNYDAVRSISGFAQEDALKNALRELVDRGLLFFIPASPARYDLHPVVRQYAYDRLTNAPAVALKIRDYFSGNLVPDDHIQSVKDLAPLMEVCHQTIRAGLYDDAASLYAERIYKLLFYRFGEIHLFQELMEEFFEDIDEGRSRLKSTRATLILAAALVAAYQHQGELERALRFAKAIRGRYAERSDAYARFLVEVADLLNYTGRLMETEQVLKDASRLLAPGWDEHAHGHVNMALAELMVTTEQFRQAAGYLRQAKRLFVGDGHWDASHEGPNIRLRIRILKKRLTPEQRVTLARRSLERSYAANSPEHLLHAELTIVTCLRELNTPTAIDEAEQRITRAREYWSKTDLIGMEPLLLLETARIDLLRGRTAEALSVGIFARVAAEKVESRYMLASSSLFLSEASHTASNKADAAQHALNAYERAWCDGPPYAYMSVLEGAIKQLATLGVPPPSRPNRAPSSIISWFPAFADDRVAFDQFA